MEQKYQAQNRTRWPYVIAALAILAVVFFFSSHERFVDADEGAYLLAARLVMEGKVVYSDFFWPQMPLLPYAYGIWMKMFGTNWYAARYFSGLLGVAMGLLLFFHVARLTGKRAMGLLAVLLFAFSSFSIGWFSTTKTYPLSTLLLFSAYLSLFADRLKEWKYPIAGVFLGLAISTRLYFIGLIPVFFWLLYRERKKLALPAAAFGRLTTGLLAGLAPSLYLLFKNPDNFYFNNIGYHFLREDYTFWASIGQKFETLPRLVGFGLVEGFVGVQFGLLLLVSAFFLYRHLRTGKKLPASVILTLCLFPFLFIPTPTHLQYFSVSAPFLILQAVLSVHQARENRKQRGLPAGPLHWAAAAALFGYAAMGAADFYEYTSIGKKVPGIGWGPEYAQLWTIPSVRTMTWLIDRNIAAEGEPVMSFWPGYMVESKAAIFPKMENHSNMIISVKIHPAKQNKYRIISNRELFLNVLYHKTRLVILSTWATGPGRESFEAALRNSGFVRILTTVDREVEVYKWDGKISPAGRNRDR